MSDDEQRILGRLETASALHGKKLDQIVTGMAEDRRVNGATRDMVLRHENGLHMGRWAIAGILTIVGLLGIDWFRK